MGLWTKTRSINEKRPFIGLLLRAGILSFFFAPGFLAARDAAIPLPAILAIFLNGWSVLWLGSFSCTWLLFIFLIAVCRMVVPRRLDGDFRRPPVSRKWKIIVVVVFLVVIAGYILSR
jgi:hypothetical protein